MSEVAILLEIKHEISKIRWNAYVLFDENERLSSEIELRMTELFAIVQYRYNEISKMKIVRYDKVVENNNSASEEAEDASTHALAV